MIELNQTEDFRKWRSKIRDSQLLGLLAARLDRLSFGHFGDVKSVGDQVFELRIHYGPGIRIYFTKQRDTLILLLCGGSKSSQQKDINTAKTMVRTWNQ